MDFTSCNVNLFMQPEQFCPLVDEKSFDIPLLVQDGSHNNRVLCASETAFLARLIDRLRFNNSYLEPIQITTLPLFKSVQ